MISCCVGVGVTVAAGITIAENSRGYGINQNGTTISYSNSVGILSSRNKSALNGQELYYNSNRIDHQEVGVSKFLNFANKRFWLGRSQTRNGSFGGKIGELITYSNRKDDASKRRKIESYLSIKYGITMGIGNVGGTMNYQNSEGNVIWNITDNAVYNIDIAGIGRDDLSKLDQKQSKSVNTIDEITIGLADIYATNTANINTFDSGTKFLVWGNNRGTLAARDAVNVNLSSGITSPSTLTTNVSFVSVVLPGK